MNSKLIAIAGAALLSASSLAIAQGSGTTVVPAGEAAPHGSPTAAPTAPATGTDGAAAANAPAADQAPEAAEAEAAPVSADAEIASAEHMKPDAQPSKDTAAEGNAPTAGDLGKYLDPAGNPTYLAEADSKVDWYTWRGYKKYMANCMQCHGPDGMGSSFAPNLAESLETLTYYDYAGIVVGGQQNKWSSSGNSIMPAWGEDPNVMCSMDAIYIYLRARADGVVGRGEPKRIANNKEAQEEEYSCLGF
ncbi:c-type cytochrome [Aurantimonas sp. A2-1-M11]|uniref:c-type cytochrome n=1 Tax=Aurantimonas sp. A2-1-M11 TaxID=3113712 RepID=UPI002F9594E6